MHVEAHACNITCRFPPNKSNRTRHMLPLHYFCSPIFAVKDGFNLFAGNCTRYNLQGSEVGLKS